MLFMNELVTYLIKFVTLGVIAVLGAFCGVKLKKNKLTKEALNDTEQEQGADIQE